MTKKPNLLFIFTDEQASNTIGYYGNRTIKTPNLDKLCKESTVFRDCYVSQPVCTPSRSTILTGLYPHTNGCIENNIPLRRDTLCFPEMASFEDYNIAYYGKWHLGDEVFPQHGFKNWRSVDDGYRKYYSPGRDMSVHSTYHDFLISNGFLPDNKDWDGFLYFSRKFCTRLPEKYSKPAYIGMEASEFIKENKDNPFVLYVNFFEPHMPFNSCRDEQYSPNAVNLPHNFYDEPDDDNPLKLKLFKKAYEERGIKGYPLKNEYDFKRIIAYYWGLVSLVDSNVGVILNTLRECGLEDNTIIAYTSDHGDMMGSHKLIAKCVMYQEAIKVPMILKIPGITKKGSVIASPVSQIDIVPTLLDAMGKDIPDYLPGASWLSSLNSKDGSADRGDVVVEWNGHNNGFGDAIGSVSILDLWRSMASEEEIIDAHTDPVRTIITPDGWKLNYSRRGEHELYNLNDDPYEIKNLAFDLKYSSLVKELYDKIKEWENKTT